MPGGDSTTGANPIVLPSGEGFYAAFFVVVFNGIDLSTPATFKFTCGVIGTVLDAAVGVSELSR